MNKMLIVSVVGLMSVSSVYAIVVDVGCMNEMAGACSTSADCTNPIYPYCVNGCCEDGWSCTSDADCGTDSGWGAHSTGYQKRTYYECSRQLCSTTKTTAYRCAAGYYGTSTNGTSGCTRCPSSGGVYGTSADGATAITSCYIPSSTSMTDTSGTYQFTTNCYYTN